MKHNPIWRLADTIVRSANEGDAKMNNKKPSEVIDTFLIESSSYSPNVYQLICKQAACVSEQSYLRRQPNSLLPASNTLLERGYFI